MFEKLTLPNHPPESCVISAAWTGTGVMFAKPAASCLRHQHHPTRPIATNVAASLTTPRRSNERRGAHENDAAVGHEAAASVSTLRRLSERRGVVEDVAAGAREASLLGDMQRSNIPAFFMKEVVTSHNNASRPNTHQEHDERHERPFVGLGALCCGHVHSQAHVARRVVLVWRASGCHHVPVRKTSASDLRARSTSWCKPQLGAAVWT